MEETWQFTATISLAVDANSIKFCIDRKTPGETPSYELRVGVDGLRYPANRDMRQLDVMPQTASPIYSKSRQR